jgi:hypothetical protein
MYKVAEEGLHDHIYPHRDLDYQAGPCLAFKVRPSSAIRLLERARRLGGKMSTFQMSKMDLSSFEVRFLLGTSADLLHSSLKN